MSIGAIPVRWPATKVTQCVRGTWLALSALAVWNTEALDRSVAHIYTSLRQTWWFRHDTFEPALSLTSFLVFLTLWYVVDTRVPALRRFRIQASEDMSHWKPEGHIKQEFFVYLVPLAGFDLLYPRRAGKLDEAPADLGFWWLVAEVVAALVVYDALFFASHVLIHKCRPVYHAVHSKHHRRTVMRARETVALTIWDEALDVACSIAALNMLRCHPLSRAVYDVVIIFLLTELHSGYDLPWMPQNVVPFGIFAGSRRHTQHHVSGQAYYQKFFVYLDNACGFTEHSEIVQPNKAKFS